MKLRNIYQLALFLGTFSVFFFPTLLYAQSATPWSFYNNPLASNAMDIFYNGAGSANPAIRIAPNGNVGIGTTSLTGKLNVNGTTILGSTTQGGVQIISTSATNAILAPSKSNGSVSITDDSQNVTRGLTVYGGNGNIGIGTSAPQGRVDISSNGGSDGLVITQQADNSQSIQGYIDGHWNDRATYAAACCNALYLQPDVGGVGIGIPATTAPPYYPIQAKLDILAGGDDTTPIIKLRQSNAASYGFDLGIDNNVDGGLYFYANNNGAQSISLKLRRDTGKVGIRTSGPPVSDLHIKQTANSQYNGGLTLERADTGNTGALFLGSDNKMYLMATGGYLTIDYTSRLDVKGDTRIDYKLAVNGYEPGACGTNYGLCVGGPSGGQSAWNNTSDQRLKKNITPISHALDKILALQGVYFDFIETEGAYKNLPKSHQLGYIAQQVEPILPEVVSTGGDGMKMMSYANITALLGEGIKEQQKQIEDQNAKIKSLTEDIELLKEEIKQLKK
jgi:hypothetical protein